MSPSQPAPLLGRIAVHLKMITPDQLAELTRDQARRGAGKHLGELMVERGWIDPAGLQKLLAAQKQVMARHRAQAAPAPAGARPAPDPVRRGQEAARRVQPTPEPGAATARPPAAGPAPAAPRTAAAAPASEADLHALLQRGVEQRASDVHLHAGLPLRFRLHGRFVVHGDAPLSPEKTRALALSALTDEQRERLEERGELDFAYEVAGLGRFRANVYRQQGGVDAVFRVIAPEPPTLDGLGLPSSLAKFTNFHQGMVLVTGPANCGKSSTLAALVRIINEERRDHVLSIEDPIEYVHKPARCVVNQRSVGPHTRSFARALRAALREDPDVIVIGELRDLETISLALTAAETGHLVLGSLHTNNTIRTINRIVGVFPADQQEQVRNMVSESLRAVVSQRLVPTADGQGRIPALEILVGTRPVGNLIRENKTFQLHSQLQMGAAHGMCLLEDSLNALLREGRITREDALAQAEDRKRIQG